MESTYLPLDSGLACEWLWSKEWGRSSSVWPPWSPDLRGLFSPLCPLSFRPWGLAVHCSPIFPALLGSSKEIQPVHSKGNQSWIFIGRIDAEAEAPLFWPPDVKSRLIGKDLYDRKDWKWEEEKGTTTEDEMVGWHHQLDGCEFEQALGVGDGQGSLVCCSPWGCKESYMTEPLNWTELGSFRSFPLL